MTFRFLAAILMSVGLVGAGLFPPDEAAQQATPEEMAATPISDEGLVVDTEAGPVQGVQANGVDHFLGMPYAAPPVDDLRWRPPEPVEPWSDVQPADEFGDRCAAVESPDGPRSESEDCLFINVQRPAGTSADADLPVYVFIHGGGFVFGGSDQYDMTEIVNETGVIGVSLNYRLGVFGFLAHPELTAEKGESGNYGLMDQQAALRWVQDNIAAFGGDPERVTLGGESAGGWSVCAHLVAPESAGLFSQAMIQSGSCVSTPQEEAELTGQAFAATAGCANEESIAGCLRAAPTGQLIDAIYPGLPSAVHETTFLPEDAGEAIAAGNFTQVPILIGANRDEGRAFSLLGVGWTQAEYEGWVQVTFTDDADAVRERYPWPEEGNELTAAYLAGDIITDSGLATGIGGCGNRQLVDDIAQHAPVVYEYEFAHRTGPGLTPEPEGYEWGAGHAAELAYLFPSYPGEISIAETFDADEQQLSSEMRAYWSAFVTDGVPDVSGQTPWPAYTEGADVLSLQAGGEHALKTDSEIADQHNCAFWEEIDVDSSFLAP